VYGRQDCFGLEQPDRRFREGVLLGVVDTPIDVAIPASTGVPHPEVRRERRSSGAGPARAARSLAGWRRRRHRIHIQLFGAVEQDPACGNVFVPTFRHIAAVSVSECGWRD
jgi:hypothetical protein